ncbi:D-alanyl-D-alanine carboxypeptidase/D-alanyl-D-alanine-endopeptidase [Candidatus Sumerlaeota bacterium]|nr:D-alanyl-D-alanine carboxypeptidase/D-alanyl-D-alanine-endopeptidase [Candidatus Sumerlaeota bacterium]
MIRHLQRLLFLILTLGSAVEMHAQQNVPYTTEQPVTADPLTEALVKKFEEANLGAKSVMGIAVVDADTGVPYVQINADKALKPASLVKIITAAAALDILGADHQFTTTIEGPAPDRKGVINGNLIIRGGGDPSLGPRFRKDSSQVLGQLNDWAAVLAKRGVKRITGNVIGNDMRYADNPTAIGWERMELAQWYSAEVSALCYNENVTDIIWNADRKTGEAASFKLDPNVKYIHVQGTVRSGPGSQVRPRVRYYRFADSNDVRARGTLPPGTAKHDFIAVHDPARYTAVLFADALKARKITVDKGAISQRVTGGDDTTTDTTTLITHQSPPISEMLPVLLGVSHNLYAEVFLREVALASGEQPTFDGGFAAVAKWLRGKRLLRNGLTMADGSGLSTVDRASATQLTEVLRYEFNSPNRDLFFGALATPGKQSLKNRFEAEEFAPLRDHLWAKTGFITNVHSLAGRFRNHKDSDYLFVIMVNDYDSERTVAARDFLDQAILMIQSSNILP